MSHLTTTSGAALVTKIFAAFLINLTSRSSNFNFTCSIKTTGYLKSLSLQYPFLGYPPVKIHNLLQTELIIPYTVAVPRYIFLWLRLFHFLVVVRLYQNERRFEWLIGSSAWNGPCLHLHQWCKDVLVLVSILDIVGITPAPPKKKEKVNMFHNFSLEKEDPFWRWIESAKRKNMNF